MHIGTKGEQGGLQDEKTERDGTAPRFSSLSLSQTLLSFSSYICSPGYDFYSSGKIVMMPLRWMDETGVLWETMFVLGM